MVMQTLVHGIKILLVPSWINFATWIFIHVFLTTAHIQAEIHLKGGMGHVFEVLQDKYNISIIVAPPIIISIYFYVKYRYWISQRHVYNGLS